MEPHGQSPWSSAKADKITEAQDVQLGEFFQAMENGEGAEEALKEQEAPRPTCAAGPAFLSMQGRRPRNFLVFATKQTHLL